MKITKERFLSILKNSPVKAFIGFSLDGGETGYKIEKRADNFYNIAAYDKEFNILGATIEQLPRFLDVLGATEQILLIEWNSHTKF